MQTETRRAEAMCATMAFGGRRVFDVMQREKRRAARTAAAA